MNLNLFSDYTVLVATLNSINLLGNIFWSLKLKAIQGKKELMEDLTDQCKAKDIIIKSLKDERRTLRFQYNQCNVEKEKLKGKLETYQHIHEQPLAI